MAVFDGKIDYFVDIDMRGNMLRQAVMETVETNPETVLVGQVIYNSKDKAFYIGVVGAEKAEWQKITTETSTGGAYVLKSVYDAKMKLLDDEDVRLAGLIANKAETSALNAVKETAEAAVTPDELDTKISDVTASAIDKSGNAGKFVTGTLATEALAGKVDAVPGSGLVETGEAAKLKNLDANANATYATKTENGKKLTGTKAASIDAVGADEYANAPTVKGALDKKLNANVVKKTALAESDDEVPTSKAVATYVKGKLTSVYKVQGSCTSVELESKPKNKGDVWNLTDATEKYGPAGTNVVYTGSEWDALGGITDLSAYAKTEDVTKGLADKVDKTITVQGHALSGNVTILASEITSGKLPASVIPELDAQTIITNSSITEDKINTGAVTTAKIGAGAVTTAKIGAGAVNADKIADGAVGNEHISADAVQTTQIKDGAVTDAKIVQVAGSKVNGAIPTASVPTKVETKEALLNEKAETAITFSTLAKVYSVIFMVGTATVIVPYKIENNIVTVNSAVAETISATAIGF